MGPSRSSQRALRAEAVESLPADDLSAASMHGDANGHEQPRPMLDSGELFLATLRGGVKRHFHENQQSFALYDSMLRGVAAHLAAEPAFLRELEKMRVSSSRASKRGVNFENRAAAVEEARGSERESAVGKAVHAVMRYRPTLQDVLDIAGKVEAFATDSKSKLTERRREALMSKCAVLRGLEAPMRELAGEIAVGNHGLVTMAANSFRNRGLSDEDLRQEGMLGLLEGVQRFDPSRGYELATYAGWWIRQRIERAIKDQARSIRIPVHMSDTIAKVNRFEEQLSVELGRAPSPEEIADECEIAVELVRRAIKYRRSVVSLQTPLSEDGATVEDTIEDDTAERPDQVAGDKQSHQKLEELLALLTDRERLVVERRFGLSGRGPETLEEIGFDFHVTRERIRQIEAKALRRLRKNMHRFGGNDAFKVN